MHQTSASMYGSARRWNQFTSSLFLPATAKEEALELLIVPTESPPMIYQVQPVTPLHQDATVMTLQHIVMVGCVVWSVT